MKDMKGVRSCRLEEDRVERAASSVKVGWERDPVQLHREALPSTYWISLNIPRLPSLISKSDLAYVGHTFTITQSPLE